MAEELTVGTQNVIPAPGKTSKVANYSAWRTFGASPKFVSTLTPEQMLAEGWQFGPHRYGRKFDPVTKQEIVGAQGAPYITLRDISGKVEVPQQTPEGLAYFYITLRFRVGSAARAACANAGRITKSTEIRLYEVQSGPEKGKLLYLLAYKGEPTAIESGGIADD